MIAVWIAAHVLLIHNHKATGGSLTSKQIQLQQQFTWIGVATLCAFAVAQLYATMWSLDINWLSDHQDVNFGTAYGTLIPDLRIQSRAVFVIGSDNTIKYAEYVPEVADHPDYDAVLACAKSL